MSDFDSPESYMSGLSELGAAKPKATPVPTETQAPSQLPTSTPIWIFAIGGILLVGAWMYLWRKGK